MSFERSLLLFKISAIGAAVGAISYFATQGMQHLLCSANIPTVVFAAVMGVASIMMIHFVIKPCIKKAQNLQFCSNNNESNKI